MGSKSDGKKHRAKRSELLATIIELDKLNADLRAWGSRGWDFAQKEFDRLKTVNEAAEALRHEVKRLTGYSDDDMTRRQHAEADAACMQKLVESLRTQLMTTEDKLLALRGAKRPVIDYTVRAGGRVTYQPIPGVTTTNVTFADDAPQQWVQGELFENTEGGTNKKTVADVAGKFCRPCNRTFQPGVMTCGRCNGPLVVVLPGKSL